METENNVNETPKEETPKEETPKEETPKEETPKEETPKEEQTSPEIDKLMEEIQKLRAELSKRFLQDTATPQVVDEVEAFVMRENGYTARALAKNK